MNTKKRRVVAKALIRYRKKALARHFLVEAYSCIPSWIRNSDERRETYIEGPIRRIQIRLSKDTGDWAHSVYRNRTWLGRRADRKLWSLASRSKTKIRFRG